MGTVGTKSICPFPFTFPLGVVNATAVDCTVTFAERLDPGWLVYQVVQLLFYSLVGMPILSYRLYKLRETFQKRGRDYTKATQFKVYVAGIWLSLLGFLTAVDPRGYRNWMPVYVFHTLAQVLGASFVLLALMVLDFWTKTANLMRRTGVTLMDVTFKVVVISTLAVFVLLLVLGMVFTDYFYLIESVKLFGGCLVLIYTFVVVVFSVRKIIYRLDPTHSTDSITTCQIFAWSYPPYFTGVEKSIMTLRKKFYMWSAVLILAIILTFVTGLGYLGFQLFAGGEPDWAWAYVIEDQPEVTLVAAHVIFMLAILLLIRSFEVPRTGSQRSSGSRFGNGKGSELEPGLPPTPTETINSNPNLNLNQTESLATTQTDSPRPTRRVSKIVVANAMGSDRPKTAKEVNAELKAQGKEIAGERKAAATRYTAELRAQKLERQKAKRESQRMRRAASKESLRASKRRSQGLRKKDSGWKLRKGADGSSGRLSKSRIEEYGSATGPSVQRSASGRLLGEDQGQENFEVSMQSLGSAGGGSESESGSGSGSDLGEGKHSPQSERILKRLSTTSALSNEQLGDAEPFRNISRESLKRRTSAVNKRRRTIKEELGVARRDEERKRKAEAEQGAETKRAEDEEKEEDEEDDDDDGEHSL